MAVSIPLKSTYHEGNTWYGIAIGTSLKSTHHKGIKRHGRYERPRRWEKRIAVGAAPQAQPTVPEDQHPSSTQAADSKSYQPGPAEARLCAPGYEDSGHSASRIDALDKQSDAAVDRSHRRTL